jgi:hypothetical protein
MEKGMGRKKMAGGVSGGENTNKGCEKVEHVCRHDVAERTIRMSVRMEASQLIENSHFQRWLLGGTNSAVRSKEE